MEQMIHQAKAETNDFKPREFLNIYLEQSLTGVESDLINLVLSARRKRLKLGLDGKPEVQMMYETHQIENYQLALSQADRLKTFWVDYLSKNYTFDFNLNIQLRDCCWVPGGKPCLGCEKQMDFSQNLDKLPKV
jgi:hypothetical protein